MRPMQSRALQTRTRLLDAALNRFDELGYLGASVGDLLEAGKVTRGALYYYFGSKEQLAIEALQSFVFNLDLELLSAGTDGSFSNLRRHFSKQIDAYEAASFSRGCLLGVLALASEEVAPALHRATSQATKEWTSAIAGSLLRNGAAGTPGRRRSAAGAILDAWSGATLRMKTMGARSPLDDFMLFTLPSLTAASRVNTVE